MTPLPAILHHLPFPPHPKATKSVLVAHAGERVHIKNYQIFAWTSLSRQGFAQFDARSHLFPSLIDPGTTRDFVINEIHLRDWARFPTPFKVPVFEPFQFRVFGYDTINSDFDVNSSEHNAYQSDLNKLIFRKLEDFLQAMPPPPARAPLVAPRIQSGIWLHRNNPGTCDIAAQISPFIIRGWASVVPAQLGGYPRLPLIGLRGLVEKKLQYHIDGENQEVFLSAP